MPGDRPEHLARIGISIWLNVRIQMELDSLQRHPPKDVDALVPCSGSLFHKGIGELKYVSFSL